MLMSLGQREPNDVSIKNGGEKQVQATRDYILVGSGYIRLVTGSILQHGDLLD